MSVKLTGSELYKLYKFDNRKEYVFLYKKKEKGYHPSFDGYLAIQTKKGKAELQWFSISDTAVYGWEEVNTIDSNHGKAMIKAMFEKNLNPSLREVLY